MISYRDASVLAAIASIVAEDKDCDASPFEAMLHGRHAKQIADELLGRMPHSPVTKDLLRWALH